MNEASIPSLMSIHRVVWISLMAALMAVGALVSIPIVPFSPVPISLQILFVMMAGLILGPRDGAFAVLLYLTAGCIGLPVFAGGKSGLAPFLGPTGGFLIGFVPTAVICGFARSTPVRPYAALIPYCLASAAVAFCFGALQLAFLLDISGVMALTVGVVPFLPGTAAQCFAAAFIYRFLAVRRLIPV